jgi:hypothetical protein
MTIRYVTTCHLEGYALYGRRFLESWKHFPAGDELVWYTEGYEIGKTERVAEKDNRDLKALQDFKDLHCRYRPPYYLWDVVRFSNKVFAAHDALRDHRGFGAWIDADMVALQDIPDGWTESLLRKGDYIAMFRRKGTHSETGFWVVDCSHPAHIEFIDTLVGLYSSNNFKTFREWTDSYLMDVVVRQFERDGKITVTNLTTDPTADHPMAAHPKFSLYLDHLKGPDRKKLGYSPERKAA